MVLKALEYLQNILPNLFEKLMTNDRGYSIAERSCKYDSNLLHDEGVVRDYINNLKEISDCNAIIDEFNQISELLDAARLKGMNLLYSAMLEEKKKDYNKSDDSFLHSTNISLLRLMIRDICSNYTDYSWRNNEFLQLAISKKSDLIWKKHGTVTI